MQLSSPGLGLVVVVALSLMSISLRRNVSCSSSTSRAHASFPATRTVTQRTSAVVRFKQQQRNLFPIMAVQAPENSKVFRLDLLRKRCNRTEQHTRRRHATVTAPFRLHLIDVGLLCTGCVIWGRRSRRPTTSKLFFSNAKRGRLTNNY